MEGGELLRYGSARLPSEAAHLWEVDAAEAAEKLRADGAPLVVDTPMAILLEEKAARAALNASIDSVPVDPTHRRNGGGEQNILGLCGGDKNLSCYLHLCKLNI